jgi:hypothetical protein
MSIKVTAARVDNGTIILLDEHGLPGQRFGTQYAVAGVSEDCLIAVTKHGNVEQHKIENGNARCIKNSLGKSCDPISVQVGSPGNFIVERANGQSDVYVNGGKVRTTGEAKVPSSPQKSSSSSPERESSYESTSYESVEIPDGILGGVAFRCKQVIAEPIKGPWATICFIIAIVCGIVGGFVAFNQTAGNIWQHYVMLAGIPIAATALGYWLKNAFAKVLVRSWYGLPAVILGIAICNTNPEVGIWVLLAAILLWVWPIWPLLLITFTFVALILFIFGKASTKNVKM